MTGGAFGDTVAQYLAACGAPKLEKPFDKLAFKRLVSERIELASDGGPLSVAQRSEDK